MLMRSNCNLTPTRQHKTFSDYGVNDYYKHYKSKGGTLSSKLFSKILKEFNKGLYPIICTPEYVYTLPKRMGAITIVKVKNFIDFTDEGKLITNLPPDWDSTLKLWAEDAEARDKKILIRVENKDTDRYTFRLVYNKANAVYKNKSIYRAQFNRELKVFLKETIKHSDFDASIYKKNGN
jgi:hypothetical protein